MFLWVSVDGERGLQFQASEPLGAGEEGDRAGLPVHPLEVPSVEGRVLDDGLARQNGDGVEAELLGGGQLQAERRHPLPDGEIEERRLHHRLPAAPQLRAGHGSRADDLRLEFEYMKT